MKLVKQLVSETTVYVRIVLTVDVWYEVLSKDTVAVATTSDS